MNPSPRNPYKPACILLLAVVLAQAVLLFRSPNPAPPAPNAADGPTDSLPNKSQPQPAQLPPSPTPQPMANHELDHDRVRATAEALDRVEAIRDLPGASLTVPLLDPSTKEPSDAYPILLGLDPQESRTFKQAIAQARETLLQKRRELAVIDTTENGSLEITVAPFTEFGQQVRDELMNALRNLLGPARTERFQALADAQLRSDFNHFGDETATFSIRRLPDTEFGGPIFKYRQKSARGASAIWSTGSSWGTRRLDGLQDELLGLVTDDLLLELPPMPELKDENGHPVF